uniref:Coenzyme Q-binding protein COQ10 START domain-containing protein n=1 Tax=Odontella aurita TaxID=265563 RepID=A0A7S4INW3_9STRA|mmetsp:Transcript_27961/g.82215  ORF Transcript_27961/g.82215 Transcript_27961/m.82215 type:complete len:545 (+) Transcript_27961:653-2287(+)
MATLLALSLILVCCSFVDSFVLVHESLSNKQKRRFSIDHYLLNLDKPTQAIPIPRGRDFAFSAISQDDVTTTECDGRPEEVNGRIVTVNKNSKRNRQKSKVRGRGVDLERNALDGEATCDARTQDPSAPVGDDDSARSWRRFRVNKFRGDKRGQIQGESEEAVLRPRRSGDSIVDEQTAATIKRPPNKKESVGKHIEKKGSNDKWSDLHHGRTAKDSRSKRVNFSASYKHTRVLGLDERYNALLDEYMMQPVEQYSVKSFHDSEDDNNTGRRRWLLRHLSEHESNPYRDRVSKESQEDEERSTRSTGGDNFFRIAVPLMPLLGLDVTPVVDLEVLPASPAVSSPTLNESSKRGRITGRKRNMLRGVLKAGRSNKAKSSVSERYDDAVRIRSLKVSLLSTEDEAQKIMKESRTNAASPDISPTSVAQNESVRKMGYEAIGMFGTLEENLKPHISFEVRITWKAGRDSPELNKVGSQLWERGESSVTVESAAFVSIKVPSLPIALPSSLLIKKLGSIIMKRILRTATNRFLRQLERDFERWANISR